MAKTVNATIKGKSKSVASSEFQELDIYRSSLTWSDIETIRVTLAKRANQRLVRLERQTSPITGEQYSSWGASTFLMDYLTKQGRVPNKDGQLRVRETRAKTEPGSGYDVMKAKAEILQLQKFLNSESSKVSKQKAFEKARVKTFGTVGSRARSGAKRRRAIDATNKEFYDFINSETYKALSKMLGSEQVVEEYDKLKSKGLSHAEILVAFDKYKEEAKEISISSFQDYCDEYKGDIIDV